MNKKEIEFYLKFHKGFRKRHTLNYALKSNLLRWSKSTSTFVLIPHSAVASEIYKKNSR